MNRHFPTIRRIPLLVLLLAVLSGCYLPARFDAEIEISRNGFYKMTFEGFIVDVNLYRDIAAKKIDKKTEELKVERLIRDLKRDSATKQAGYFVKGAFKVKWQRSGDILRSRLVTFLRRSEDMLSIRYNKNTGLVEIRGKAIARSDKERLYAAGLNMQGDLRVKTDARVISHNATSQKKDGAVTVYSWKINDIFDPSPKLVLAFR